MASQALSDKVKGQVDLGISVDGKKPVVDIGFQRKRFGVSLNMKGKKPTIGFGFNF